MHVVEVNLASFSAIVELLPWSSFSMNALRKCALSPSILKAPKVSEGIDWRDATALDFLGARVCVVVHFYLSNCLFAVISYCPSVCVPPVWEAR